MTVRKHPQSCEIVHETAVQNERPGQTIHSGATISTTNIRAEETARYASSWRKYRQFNRLTLLFIIPGLPLFVVVVGGILTRTLPHLFGFGYALATGIWAVLFSLICLTPYHFIKCPRCGNTFFFRYLNLNPDVRRCRYCGLRKYAPDGDLKVGQNMKRIILIGSGGSGKSTLARKLGDVLRKPVYHLDRFYWHPNWVPTPNDEWKEIQKRLCSAEEWIIDGNYGGTMDIRLLACDTIIFLNMPRLLCLIRVLQRYISYRGKWRPDMTNGCLETIDRKFMQWIWEYPKTKRPAILKKLDELSADKRVFILNSPNDVANFVKSLN